VSRYRVLLALAFAAVWTWAAVAPLFRQDWLLENLLVFLFVPLVLLTGRYFRLSNLSYTLVTLFLALHVVGSHYTYAHVPFGETLKDWFDASRNMYDRLVHFAFGLLMAYPMREMFVRVTRARGFWGYSLPVELTLAFSALYEVLEWLTAASVDPEAGLAFLGAQGDPWDAQKDMLLAGMGACVAMLATAAVHVALEPRACLRELRESLRLPAGDAPLGEGRLKELLRR